MTQLRVVAKMLRYRVASLLVPFFLLAPALHGRLDSLRWQYVAGLVALFSSYVVATCLNDLFDRELDRVNHPVPRDRPLVSGEATPRRMVLTATVAAAVAAAAGAAIGPTGIGLIFVSLFIDVAYSVPPVRLCARWLAPPVVLACAYVALPYSMGLAASGDLPDIFDARVAGALTVLFVARMLLKDFRDRAGDAAFGKRTFLLARGKPATLLTTLACLLLGDALLVSVMPPTPVLVVVIQTYFAGVAIQLWRLWQAGDFASEQAAIALGARMGNATILTLLGSAILVAAGANPTEQSAFVIALALVFWSVFGYLLARPRRPIEATARPA
jgi:4-hydroxybenzoate polyprenyltransferase